MTDQENIILTRLGLIRDDLSAIRNRLGVIETQNASMHRDISGMYEQYASLSVRMDAMANAIERVSRRLELAD